MLNNVVALLVFICLLILLNKIIIGMACYTAYRYTAPLCFYWDLCFSVKVIWLLCCPLAAFGYAAANQKGVHNGLERFKASWGSPFLIASTASFMLTTSGQLHVTYQNPIHELGFSCLVFDLFEWLCKSSVTQQLLLQLSCLLANSLSWAWRIDHTWWSTAALHPYRWMPCLMVKLRFDTCCQRISL